MELLEFHDRADVAHVAPNARNLKRGSEFVAVAWLIRVVDPVFDKAERRHAVDDAVQSILPLDAAAERQVLEEVVGSGAEGSDVGPVQAVSEAYPLERVANRITDRDAQAGGRLVVVLQQ